MRDRGAGPALAALAACAICYAAGWQGTDWAAQAYRAAQSAHYGLIVWDPGWYGGTFPLNYSLIYPLAAGWLGLWPVAGVSAAAAAFCWDRLMVAHCGRRPLASWYFALSTVIAVAIGQLPTLSGEALGLGSVLSLASAGHRGGQARPLGLAAGAALALAAALTTPLAGLFLALSLAAWALSNWWSETRAWAGRAQAAGEPKGWPSGPVRLMGSPRALAGAGVPAATAALALAAAAVLPLVFPSPGYFPFIGADLAAVVLLCALLASPVLGAPSWARVSAVLYAVLSVGLFVVPTQVGGNDARYGAYIGAPLTLCYLLGPARRPQGHPRPGPPWAWRLAFVLIAVGLVGWEWQPIVEAVDATAHGPSARAAFYRPLENEVEELSGGRPVRVEVPPILHHWESDYLAQTFALARGWERQLDMGYDPLFYTPGALTPQSYRSWLLDNGVSFVALAAAPLDYAGVAEARLLTSGHALGLEPVWHDRYWRLWRVAGAAGLVSPPARVTAMGPGEVIVSFSRAGTAELKVRWTPHWSSAQTGSKARGGPPAQATCVAEAPGGWTQVSSGRAGTVRLSISAWGGAHGRCGHKDGLRSSLHRK